MLDNLDLDISLDKETYEAKIEVLMKQLRSLQLTCREKKLPAIIVLEGWAAAGKGALVKKMVGYMDPRGFGVHPIWPPSEAEMGYPFLCGFGRNSPPAAKLVFFTTVGTLIFRRPIVRSTLRRRSTNSYPANQRLRAADGR